MSIKLPEEAVTLVKEASAIVGKELGIKISNGWLIEPHVRGSLYTAALKDYENTFLLLAVEILGKHPDNDGSNLTRLTPSLYNSDGNIPEELNAIFETSHYDTQVILDAVDKLATVQLMHVCAKDTGSKN